MPLSMQLDTLYSKDARSFVVNKGEVKELRYKIPYGSNVTVRVSVTNPVIITMTGPYTEQAEITGLQEYRFTAEPGSELIVRFQGKSGLLAKSANVSFEVEMYTARDAIKVSEELSNLLEVLREMGKDYYLINKPHVQDVLRRLVNVWKILGPETRGKAKELMNLAKEYETSPN